MFRLPTFGVRMPFAKYVMAGNSARRAIFVRQGGWKTVLPGRRKDVHVRRRGVEGLVEQTGRGFPPKAVDREGCP